MAIIEGTNPGVAADTVLDLEGSRNSKDFTFILSQFGGSKTVRLEAQANATQWVDVTPGGPLTTDANGNLVFDYSVAAGGLTLRIVVANNDDAAGARPDHTLIWHNVFTSRERFY